MDFVRRNFGLSAPFLRFDKAVSVGALDIIESLPFGIERERSISYPVEYAQIVEPENVIGVRMGVKHRIYSLQSEFDGAEPKFGWGVDYYMFS
jgi:hypothetical protein